MNEQNERSSFVAPLKVVNFVKENLLRKLLRTKYELKRVWCWPSLQVLMAKS